LSLTPTIINQHTNAVDDETSSNVILERSILMNQVSLEKKLAFYRKIN
jgi:hypothetical protein